MYEHMSAILPIGSKRNRMRVKLFFIEIAADVIEIVPPQQSLP